MSFDLIYIANVWCRLQKKVTFFETNCKKCQFKLSHFTCRANGTWNQDLRTPQTCFNAMNLMAVSKLENELPLKITFFEISSIVSICMKFQ